MNIQLYQKFVMLLVEVFGHLIKIYNWYANLRAIMWNTFKLYIFQMKIQQIDETRECFFYFFFYNELFVSPKPNSALTNMTLNNVRWPNWGPAGRIPTNHKFSV